MAKDPARYQEVLLALARKYIWWKTPEEAVRFPNRVIAQVMELGTFEDVQNLVRTAGIRRLKDVVMNAEAGWFTPKSWHYWHLRMELSEIGHIPPLPERKIP